MFREEIDVSPEGYDVPSPTEVKETAMPIRTVPRFVTSATVHFNEYWNFSEPYKDNSKLEYKWRIKICRTVLVLGWGTWNVTTHLIAKHQAVGILKPYEPMS